MVFSEIFEKGKLTEEDSQVLYLVRRTLLWMGAKGMADQLTKSLLVGGSLSCLVNSLIMLGSSSTVVPLLFDSLILLILDITCDTY